MSSSKRKSTRTISVGALARVEGEGGLTIRMRDGHVEDVQLRIYEPPRFYEAFMRGRSALEAPDITARICGICPVAYQMSAVHAIEKIHGVTMPPSLRALRRLLYCGEWIESHTLHIYLLHAPDFLGFESAVAMAQAQPEYAKIVRRGLRLKKAGNSIVDLVGGRAIHPINVRVGGFYRAPTIEQLQDLAEELKWARDAAMETVRWAASLEFPDFAGDYEFVALRHPDEYPMNEGRVVSSGSLDIAQEEYPQHFEEYQVPHSNALYSRRKSRDGHQGAYFVGPLARWNLNADRATPLAREAARQTGLALTSGNPYAGIVARSLEVLLAVEEALRIIGEYEPPARPSVPFEPAAGVGQAITEAPRGILYHRYETDASGMIRQAVIIPPTSQNQLQMEHDLARVAPQLVTLPNKQAALRAEHVIRNYDPCISCATHFLTLKVESR
ncbi:MAG: Ni/Fe hydrogenase subunit alpha [Planctomycetes bacterium]|nr:Ni/Fe hydrogenase subunit alpha [Planctomycetota bacterium]